MKLVFATHNQNKLKEVKALLPKNIELLSLTDINCHDEIPETAKTLEGNAQIKADFVAKNYNLNCFSDDTGLEVFALDGVPGVYSARYAGAEKSAEANMSKLLQELSGNSHRKAQFRTAIALNLNGKNYLFEGVCKGEILTEKQGNQGFGYDPIFKPDGFENSFAEMTMNEKSCISHRGRAIEKLVNFLSNL